MDAKELEKIKYDIQKLEAMIEVLAKNVEEIKDALVGNEFGQEGLVKKVNKNQADIAELQKFKQKVIAWATGAGLGSSALVNAIAEYMK